MPTTKFSPEVRERAVRMVAEHRNVPGRRETQSALSVAQHYYPVLGPGARQLGAPSILSPSLRLHFLRDISYAICALRCGDK